MCEVSGTTLHKEIPPLKERQRLGREALERVFLQQNPKLTEVPFEIPVCELRSAKTIVSTSEEELDPKELYPKELQPFIGASPIVRVTVKDRILQVRSDKTFREFWIRDKTNNLVPTDELYEDIGRHRKGYCDDYIASLMLRFGYPDSEEELRKLLITHQQFAKKHHVRLDVENTIQEIEKRRGAGKPSGCYTSRERAESQVPSERTHAYGLNHPNLDHLNELLFFSNPAFIKNDGKNIFYFGAQICNEIFFNLRASSRMKQKAAKFIYYYAGIMATKLEERASSLIPDTGTFDSHAAAGLLFLGEAKSFIQLLKAAAENLPPETRKLLYSSIELIQGPNPESIERHPSWDEGSSSYLGLDEFEENINMRSSYHQFGRYRKPYKSKLNTRVLPNNVRLENKPTDLSRISIYKNDRGNLYHYLTGDISQVLVEQDVVYQDLNYQKLKRIVSHTLEAITTSSWKEHADPEHILQSTRLLNYLLRYLEFMEVHEMNPDESMLRLNKLFSALSLVKDHPYIKSARDLQNFIVSGNLTAGISDLFNHIRGIGYPVFVPQYNKSKPSGLHISGENRAVHLLQQQTSDVLNPKDYSVRLESVLQKEYENQQNHLGVRLQEVAFRGDNNILCEKVTGNRPSEEKIIHWQMSGDSIDFIQGWFSSLKSTNSANKKIYPLELARSFIQYLSETIKPIIADMAHSAKRTDRLENAQQIRKMLYSLYEVYCMEKGNYLCSAGLLRDVIEMYKQVDSYILVNSTDEVIPPGEIHMKPGSLLVIEGSNSGGKSTMLRQIGLDGVLSEAKCPLPGEASIPSGITISTPESKLDTGSGSLLKQQLMGYNRMAEHSDSANVWLLDEPGRTTSSRYGQALFAANVIQALTGEHTRNYVLAATHYHDIKQLKPLFDALGIPSQFKVLESRRLHDLQDGEIISSEAYRLAAKEIPGPWLTYWPGHTVEQKNERQSEKKGIDTDAQTIHDLFELTTEEKKIYRYTEYRDFAQLLGLQSAKTARAFIDLLKSIDDGKNLQQVLENLTRIPALEVDVEVMENVETVLAKTAAEQNWVDLQDSITDVVRTSLGQFPNIVGQIKSIVEGIRDKNGNSLINVAELDILFDSKKIVEYHGHSNRNKCLSFLHTVSQCLALLKYAKKIAESQGGYTKVTYTDKHQVEVKGVWNPLLIFQKREDQVPNDFAMSLDPADKNAGTFITGENAAGKSNYMRATSLALFLAQKTGYAPAEKVTIPSDLRVVSFTQPVTDKLIGESSMQAELRRRIGPAIAEGKKPHTIVFLDEPGAPTSPLEAAQMIKSLFEYFYRDANGSRICITSHCDDVPEMLKQAGVDVEQLAFKLLCDEQEKYKVQRGSADSNALEVCKHYGLNEKSYSIAVLVYEYMNKIEQGADPTAAAQETAQLIKSVLQPTEVKTKKHQTKGSIKAFNIYSYPRPLPLM